MIHLSRLRSESARVLKPRLPRLTLGLAAASMLLATLGCGSLPVPQMAVEGTTMMVAIPENFPTGFGRSYTQNPAFPAPAYNNASPLEDPQRGELLFELVDGSGNPPDGVNPVFLPLRYITRVDGDAGSPGMFGGQLSVFEGQTVAFLDVPLNAVTDDTVGYFIKVKRVRRIVGNVDAFEIVDAFTSDSQDWTGWGGLNWTPGPIPVRILNSPDGVARFTPKNGWGDLPPLGLASDNWAVELDSLVPYPEAWISAEQVSGTGPPPAAWQVDVSYPRKRIRIHSVTAKEILAGTAMVLWSADTATSMPCGTPDDTLKIQVVDPSRSTRSVRVAFELENFEDACGNRAAPADFQTSAFKAYDENGVEDTVTWVADVSPDAPAFQ